MEEALTKLLSSLGIVPETSAVPRAQARVGFLLHFGEPKNISSCFQSVCKSVFEYSEENE
jgi:hypothetical protein